MQGLFAGGRPVPAAATRAHIDSLENMASRRAARPEPHEPTSEPEWSAEQLGRRLRELRTARGLRLSDLAGASGLSVSFLSQVEQGQSDIAVGRLMRIAHALEVRLTELVELPAAPARPVVRAGERTNLPTPTEGLKIELLADSLSDGQIYALSHLAAGSSIEARGVRPAGQQYFIYMLEGSAVIEFSSGDPLTLEEGDSISFTSEDFRRLTNHRDVTTRLLWVSNQS
jgi:transcriptional regulator with XRE-family HTH domain